MSKSPRSSSFDRWSASSENSARDRVLVRRCRMQGGQHDDRDSVATDFREVPQPIRRIVRFPSTLCSTVLTADISGISIKSRERSPHLHASRTCEHVPHSNLHKQIESFTQILPFCAPRRMEVIAKQIAFLSKETAQHPSKPSSNTSSRDEESRSLGSLQRSSTTVEDDDQAEPSEPTQEVSAQGPPLVVRLELYERLRQSRATPQDLFPAKLLQVSAPAIPLLGRRSGFDAPASRTITFSAGSAIPRKVERVPPPGLFHQFVRHVRPFSLCPDSGSTGTRLEDTLPSSHHQADHLAPPEPTGGAGFKARMTPTESPGGGGDVNETAEETPESQEYLPGCPSSLVEGTEEEPPWTHPGLARRKRKACHTPSDPAPTGDGSDSDIAPTSTKSRLGRRSPSPSDKGAPSSKRSEKTNKASARTRRSASKTKAGRTDGAFRMFSRRAAIEFWRLREKRVQHAPTLQTKPNRKEKRGGGRGIRPVQISLPTWSTGIGNTNSSMGTLNLSHPDVHVDIPEIKNPGDYLVSIASPSRCLPSMKRSLQQRSGSAKHLQGNRAQQSGSTQKIDDVAEEPETFDANEGGASDTRGDSRTPPSGLRAVKVNEKRGSIISNLRKSIARLDFEHRTQAERSRGGTGSPRSTSRRQEEVGGENGGMIFHEEDRTTKLFLSLQNAVRGNPETFGVVGESPQEARSIRMFTVLVSLVHVHNISSTPNDRGTCEGGFGSLPSQLHLSLSEQWTDVVVTAREA